MCGRPGTQPAVADSPSHPTFSKTARREVCVPRHLPAPSGRRRQQRARPLPSSLHPGRPGLWPEGAWTPARLPAPRACSRPTRRRREILTQARKGDGGVMLGARLLGAVRVWAEAGRCLPAVVRLLLLRGHGQAALPGRPAGGLPWHLGGAPAQDGLNGEAGDAAGRRTPLACIFLAAHPGFIRNRRKPRTPFRDDLGGRWCRQAGRRGEGRGGEPGGGGGEAGEASPLRGGHAGTGWLRGDPCPPGSGCARPAPARMPLPCPPARGVSAGAEVARPHLHRGYPNAANRSAAERPRKFSKSPGPARSDGAPRSAPRTRRASAVSMQGQPGGKQQRFQPQAPSRRGDCDRSDSGPLEGQGQRGASELEWPDASLGRRS